MNADIIIIGLLIANILLIFSGRMGARKEAKDLSHNQHALLKRLSVQNTENFDQILFLREDVEKLRKKLEKKS